MSESTIIELRELPKREIKFRAWHFGIDRMFSSEELTKDMDVIFSHKNMRPLQFTGLMDVNGLEVYEGDICIMREIKLSGTNEFLGVITWGTTSWHLRFLSPRGHLLKRRLGEFHQAQIIGNIFQNTNLIPC